MLRPSDFLFGLSTAPLGLIRLPPTVEGLNWFLQVYGCSLRGSELRSPSCGAVNKGRNREDEAPSVSPLLLFPFLLFFPRSLTRSFYVAQANLELTILLPQSSKYPGFHECHFCFVLLRQGLTMQLWVSKTPRDLPAFAFKVLGLKVCFITPSYLAGAVETSGLFCGTLGHRTYPKFSICGSKGKVRMESLPLLCLFKFTVCWAPVFTSKPETALNLSDQVLCFASRG